VSGEPFCVWRTFLCPIPSESLVASGTSGRHGPLSPRTPQKTAHLGREFTLYAPRLSDAHGAQGVSGCNLFLLLMDASPLLNQTTKAKPILKENPQLMKCRQESIRRPFCRVPLNQGTKYERYRGAGQDMQSLSKAASNIYKDQKTP